MTGKKEKGQQSSNKQARSKGIYRIQEKLTPWKRHPIISTATSLGIIVLGYVSIGYFPHFAPWIVFVSSVLLLIPNYLALVGKVRFMWVNILFSGIVLSIFLLTLSFGTDVDDETHSLPREMFREVPSSTLFDLGNNIRFGESTLLDPVVTLNELLSIPPVSVPSKILVELKFMLDGRLLLSAMIPDDDPKFVAAAIKENVFTMNNPQWDRNFDDFAFEIVDENLTVRFRVARVGNKVISIRGVFVDSLGQFFLLSDGGYSSEGRFNIDIAKDSPIMPLFQYPSSLHPHERNFNIDSTIQVLLKTVGPWPRPAWLDELLKP